MRLKTPITFFGSGPVAARSLELLLPHFDIVAVVTKPKPAHHRGEFPVLALCEQHKLTTYTVTDKASLSALISERPFQTEVAILIDFGIIVSRDVIDYFPKGIINSHFSLLPQWRGADPINFAILSGQVKTGVSLMLIDEGMDTGKLIGQKTLALDQTETSPELTDKLVHLSAEILPEYTARYLAGEVVPRAQPHPDRATYSRKLTKEDGVLDFTKPAEELEREIRAFIEWPKSRTTLAGIDVIITSASVSENSGEPGAYEIKDKQLYLFCSTGSLCINKLKPAGKAEMTAQAFIAGYSSNL